MNTTFIDAFIDGKLCATMHDHDKTFVGFTLRGDKRYAGRLSVYVRAEHALDVASVLAELAAQIIDQYDPIPERGKL